MRKGAVTHYASFGVVRCTGFGREVVAQNEDGASIKEACTSVEDAVDCLGD
ncbi:hypothetical protein KI387_025119, partial [Taxus chinensis]